MNVLKCSNSHFYDGDKYQICPHCGAVSIEVSGTKLNTFPKKEKKKAFLLRKKKEDDTDTEVIRRKDGRDTEVIEKTVEINMTDDTMQDTLKDSDEKDPIAEKLEENLVDPASDEIGDDMIQSIVDLEGNASMLPPKSTLKDAIKNVTTGSEGKTVGFFSNGGEVETEPVVGWLVCIRGKHFGESFNVSAGRNSIGRNSSNQIAFMKEKSISREKHAWIAYEPKKREFFIQPGDSSGLVYLNGENIMESIKLQSNDRLELGDGMFVFIPLCGELFSWDDYIVRE